MAYLNTSNLLTSDLKMLITGTHQNQLNVGRMGISEPLEFHLVSIARFLNDDFWANDNIQHWDSICPTMMQRNISVIKQNLLKAMNEYPSTYHIISAPSGKYMFSVLLHIRFIYSLPNCRSQICMNTTRYRDNVQNACFIQFFV